MRVLGLMSGTSMDGIDAAIVKIGAGKHAGSVAVDLEAFATTPYPRDMRSSLEALIASDSSAKAPHLVVRDLCALNFAIGEAFAAAALSIAGDKLGSVDLIGSHGQTVYHLPDDDGVSGFVRSTLQVGEPAVIAARTGITCVADFRVADIAAGGQGAPLVSYADFLLLRDATEDRVALNVGGIANLTVLPAGAGLDGIRAFDIGPGNVLIDLAVAHFTGGAKRYDDRGAIAASSAVWPPLLDWLQSHPYFARSSPKTTGRETFGAAYFRKILDAARGFGATGDQTIASLTACAAAQIAKSVPASTDRVIASGGGASNDALMANLRSALAERFPSPPVVSLSDEFGMPADAKEAMAFAMLARETVLGRPGNAPGATGARRPVILGKIVLGDNFSELVKMIYEPAGL
ncbi:MAG TPA: anhydro-N-acetylmuramic acid kinase [Candidatus Eremiobacteraceae bacterium]